MRIVPVTIFFKCFLFHFFALLMTSVEYIVHCFYHILLFYLQEKQRAKVVVALYPFKAIENGDLSLEKVI